MASQGDIAESDELHFTGESAQEAEDFIQAVNKRAYVAGKQKDNAWIAEFAHPFFSGQALRWYEELDEETQTDWKLLKRAIFAEFGRRHPAPSTVPSAALAPSSSSSPYAQAAPPPYAPAAPSPSTVTTKLGRIRVHFEEVDRGYLALKANDIGIEVNFNEASVFEVDTSGGTIKLKGEAENLAIYASAKNASFTPGKSYYGVISRASKKFGSPWSSTWSLAGDGNVVTSWLQAGERNAQFTVYKLSMGKSVYVPTELHKFLERNPDRTLATLHFEPMS